MKPRNSLNKFARELRNNSTDTERLLWRHLRNSQLEGVKFRRQQEIEAYIVDFVSFDKRIVIETADSMLKICSTTSKEMLVYEEMDLRCYDFGTIKSLKTLKECSKSSGNSA